MAVVEPICRDKEPINLGERDVPVGERLCDPTALPKQPIPILGPMTEKALYGCSLVAGRTAISFRRSADEDAIRPKHCPLGATTIRRLLGPRKSNSRMVVMIGRKSLSRWCSRSAG